MTPEPHVDHVPLVHPRGWIVSQNGRDSGLPITSDSCQGRIGVDDGLIANQETSDRNSCEDTEMSTHLTDAWHKGCLVEAGIGQCSLTLGSEAGRLHSEAATKMTSLGVESIACSMNRVGPWFVLVRTDQENRTLKPENLDAHRYQKVFSDAGMSLGQDRLQPAQPVTYVPLCVFNLLLDVMLVTQPPRRDLFADSTHCAHLVKLF